MYSMEQLKQIGKEYCQNLIGLDIIKDCQGSGFFGYNEEDNDVFCSMGCNKVSNNNDLTLTEGNNWDYYAECFVDLDGNCHDSVVNAFELV